MHSATSQSAVDPARPLPSRIGTAEFILGVNSVTSQSAINSALVPLWNCCDITTVQPYYGGTNKKIHFQVGVI